MRATENHYARVNQPRQEIGDFCGTGPANRSPRTKIMGVDGETDSSVGAGDVWKNSA